MESRLAAFALLIFSLSLHAGEVDVERLHKADWMHLETDNFELTTNASEKSARAMAEDLEGFYFFVTELLGYDQGPMDKKVSVILARNASTFRSMGIPREYGGVFLRIPLLDEIVIFANASKFSRSSDGRSNLGRSTVLHELMHLINQNESIGLANPPWYNEGIAEYFGTYVQRKGRVMLGDMTILKHRFSAILTPLGNFESIDSESLFKTTQQQLPIADDSSGKENRTVAKFYARSAAVVHFLNADPERRRRMYTYLKLLHKGYDIDECFNYAFEMGYSDFDALVDKYLNGRFVMARTFPIGNGGVEFPRVRYSAARLQADEAMRIIIPKIALFSDSFIGEGNREKMHADIARLYPDLFD